MDFISYFFIVLSLFAIGYVWYSSKSKRRISILVEVFFLAIYGIVLLIFIFPGLLKFFEVFFGISSAINFFMYLAIFVLFLIVYNLYQKIEEQRVEITKLVREISLMRVDNGNKK